MARSLTTRTPAAWLLALALASLAPGSPARADTQARRTLVYCSEANPNQFQGALAGDQTSLDAGSRQVFDRLLRLRERDGRQVLEPSLATSWTLSADAKVYTLQLRRGVRFQANHGFTPSREFNAQDVVFSFRRMMDKHHPYHDVSGGVYPTFQALGLSRTLRSVDALGPHAVRFVLNTPNAPFLADLAMDFASINSAEYAQWLLRQGRPTDLDRKPLGTGPFELVSYQSGSVIRYRAFAQYWGGAPRIDRLVFAITPNPAVRWARLRAGECQVMADPNPADLAAMRADPNLRVLTAPGTDIAYLAFNLRRPPLDNVLVRRALAMAVNRKAIVEHVYRGSARLALSPLPPTLWSYDGALPDLPYDPAQARRLLARAGYAAGFETDIWAMSVSRPYLSDARRVAQMIQADWAAVGVRAQVHGFEWGEYVHGLQQHLQHTALLGWAGDNGDPDYFLGNLLSCDAASTVRNAAGFCDPRYQQLIEQARLQPGQEQRTLLYRKAQRVFREQLPWIPLAYPDVVVPMSTRVHGYVMPPNGGHEFQGVWLQ